MGSRQGLTALFLLQTVLYVQSSLIQIDSENHLYQRLTVEVTDQVPRHLCQETLSHLEVRKLFCDITYIFGLAVFKNLLFQIGLLKFQ